jgi:ketosteroid isomerase-like protein
LKDSDGRVTSCFKVFQKETLIDQGCTGVTIVRRGQIIFDGLTQHEPAYVVGRYYQALNAKDLELAMSFVASDAVFINPTGTYEGTEAIRESLGGLNKDGITFEVSNLHGFLGRIVYDYKVMQGENLLDQGSNGLTIVKDGKIIFDGTEDTDPSAAVQVDPAAIAQEFYKATNAGDLEAAMALVAEDVKCRGSCYLNGKESFRSFIQGSINIGGGGGRVELSDLNVDGDKVTYTWEAFSKDGFFQARGVETLQIQDGLIVLMETIAQ